MLSVSKQHKKKLFGSADFNLLSPLSGSTVQGIFLKTASQCPATF